jgi:ribosomal protein S27AE
MTETIPVTLTVKKFFDCPACGQGEFRYDHLEPGRSWGSWACDECGVWIDGTISAAGLPQVKYSEKLPNIPTLVLLRLRKPLKDGAFVHAVIEAKCHDGKEDLIGSGDEFLYNEHTCPTNWLGIAIIIDGEDTDPHGVFEWVATVKRPDDWDMDNERDFDGLCELFPALREACTVIDGELTPPLIVAPVG